MDRIEQSDRHKQRSIEEVILLAFKGIRYGSVEIIVHDSKVVQIERKEDTVRHNIIADKSLRFTMTIKKHCRLQEA